MIAPWLEGLILTGYSPSDIAAQPWSDDTKNLIGPEDMVFETLAALIMREKLLKASGYTDDIRLIYVCGVKKVIGYPDSLFHSTHHRCDRPQVAIASGTYSLILRH